MRFFQTYVLSAVLCGLGSNAWTFARRIGYSNNGQHALGLNPDLDIGSASPYDAGLFSPLENLAALSETEFTTLGHPAFPRYGVRMKKTKFCDERVRAFTGYIDIEARHLFFYFFESRNDPEKDDVILWTNGGPGCSSSLGLFMELGPCSITDELGTVYNPYSWNARSNIFFIDQPIGVGFSYAEYGESVGTTNEAAQDIANFVYIFFENFSNFKGRRFHLAGESYAGRYLPIFAAHIYDQNLRLSEQGIAPINLTSIMIGNGYTHPTSMVESYYELACTAASVHPVLGVNACVRMKEAQIRCHKWMERSCVDTFDELGCLAAMTFCLEQMTAPLDSTGLNPYDISKKCEGPLEETLCYPVTKHISAYLDRPDVRSLIGVDSSLNSRNFSSCSNKVGVDFTRTLDSIHPTHHYVASLLEHGVKVLIFVGKNDWICNHVGNERWASNLDWSGKEGFGNAQTREWYSSTEGGKRAKAGDYKTFGNLVYMTIEGAGHMVPYDKPKEALTMLENWLAGTYFHSDAY